MNVKGSGSGGELELENLLRRLWPDLEAIVRRFRIAPEDADDVIQQAMLHFLRKRSKVHNPEYWLRGAVRNECRMYCRGRDRRRTVAMDQAILELVAGGKTEEPERAIMRRNLDLFIEILPRNCQTLLHMRYYLELDQQEVAEETGYRPSSVDKVTKRCIDMLGRKMASIAVHRRTRR